MAISGNTHSHAHSGGWTLAGCQMPTRLRFHCPFSAAPGEKIRQKSSWDEIGRDITYQLGSQAKQTQLGKNKFCLLPITNKVGWTEAKTKSKTPSSHLLSSQAQLHSFVPDSSTSFFPPEHACREQKCLCFAFWGYVCSRFSSDFREDYLALFDDFYYCGGGYQPLPFGTSKWSHK